MESGDLGFEMVSASLRADTRDLDTFVEVLATKLEGALPNQTVVQRKGGGLFSREKRVRKINVSLGDRRYQLDADAGKVETSLANAVRGIVLKTERVPLDEWITSLSQELAEAAQESEQARLALERLVSG